MPRYLTSDGQVNWNFIRDMRLGLVPVKTEQEAEVLAAYGISCSRLAVIRHLADSGEIVIVSEGTNDYRKYLEDRRRQRSANGRGRRTHR